MSKLVLLRHGQSVWNEDGKFTGWTDVDLSSNGMAEAHTAGQRIKAEKIVFDVVHTSVLKRAIRTAWIAVDELDQMWVPIQRSWRLNERHYGALQGLNKDEISDKYGSDKVHAWRRGYDIRPPALDFSDPRHPRLDPRYSYLDPELLPPTESLKDTLERMMPYWQDIIYPEILEGKNILIAAHGNSLRALIKHLDAVSDNDIASVEIPTGVPLVYDIEDRAIVGRRFLASGSELEAGKKAAAKVK